MKRIIFILSIFMIAISCNSLSTSEKSIQEYMRTQTGSPDLEIEFTNVQITKQTVGDSIDILQKIFEEQIKEKEKTIKRIENDNQAWQKELESMSKKDQNYAFLVQMVNSNQRRIKELQEKVIKNGTGYYDGSLKNDKMKTFRPIPASQVVFLRVLVSSPPLTRELRTPARFR